MTAITSPVRHHATKWPTLVVLVLLLLFQAVLRFHDITEQNAFVDEGYHNERAAIVWHFTQNPGQFSNGKLLTYFWIGLFSGPSTTNLFTSRISIALISLVTVAFLYLLGRRFHSHEAGLLAVFLYAIAPMAIFHERMALADPFASMFACAVVWRSLVFGRRPTIREGALIGLLLALATMAKLTLGLLPLIPVVATILYFPNLVDNTISPLGYWLRRYFPPLVVAALVSVVLWLPILIPAAIAHNTPNEFDLLDAKNVAATGARSDSIIQLMIESWDAVAELTAAPFLAAGLIALIALPLFGLHSAKTFYLFQAGALILAWFLVTTIPTLAWAGFTNSRYFVPPFAAVVLAFAIVFVQLWRLKTTARPLMRFVRPVLGLAVVAWAIVFALPFDLTMMRVHQAPLTASVSQAYVRSNVNGDSAIRAIATIFTEELPATTRLIYGDYYACHLLYFYTARPVGCLDYNTNVEMKHKVIDALQPGEIAYVVLGAAPDPASLTGLCQPITRQFIRDTGTQPISLWQLQRPPCSADQ